MTGEATFASGDPFGGQPSDAAALAEIYDLEHDPVTSDFAFYRELTRRVRGPVLDLGCGSGRLFGAFLDGNASRIVAVDASAAMLRHVAAPIQDAPPVTNARCPSSKPIGGTVPGPGAPAMVTGYPHSSLPGGWLSW